MSGNRQLRILTFSASHSLLQKHLVNSRVENSHWQESAVAFLSRPAGLFAGAGAAGVTGSPPQVPSIPGPPIPELPLQPPLPPAPGPGALLPYPGPSVVLSVPHTWAAPVCSDLLQPHPLSHFAEGETFVPPWLKSNVFQRKEVHLGGKEGCGGQSWQHQHLSDLLVGVSGASQG